jgi:hypothetical protein
MGGRALISGSRPKPRAVGRILAALAVLAAVAGLDAAGAGASANAIRNGDFSQGLTGWTAGTVSHGKTPGYPHIGVTTISRCDPSQGTNPFVALDVPSGANGYIEQQISVPTSAATLTFKTWGNLQTVTATISVVTSSGVQKLLTYTPPPLQASVTTCSKAAPVVKSIDLSAFAGQRVTLRVEATSTGFDGTIADFDNFQLGAGGGGSSGPTPVLAQTVAASTVSGTVTVEKPGSTTFVPLRAAELIAVGSTVDATHGRVALVAAGTSSRVTHMGEFYGGEFTVTQGPSGLTILTLAGGTPCAAPAAAAARPAAHQRKLWGVAHGGFKTSGSYASATELGTQWLTKDTCTGTLVRVKAGAVRVRDLIKHRSLTLRAPHSYFAHA